MAVARRYGGASYGLLDFEDHLQNARIGVARAVQTWDGVGTFGTWAWICARGAVSHGIRAACPVSAWSYDAWRRYERAAAVVGDDPAAVAAHMGVTATEAAHWRGWRPPPPPLSLDGPRAVEATGYDVATTVVTRATLLDALRALPDRQMRLVVRTYLEGWTLRAAAAEEGMAENYAGRLRQKALARLRVLLAEEVGPNGDFGEA